MIYVVQRNNSLVEHEVIYAGSSAHEALMAASKYNSCMVRIFKNGKKFQVLDNTEQLPKQSTKGSGSV